MVFTPSIFIQTHWGQAEKGGRNRSKELERGSQKEKGPDDLTKVTKERKNSS
jgi:hypothetical protein